MKFTIIKAMIIRGFSEKEIFDVISGSFDFVDEIKSYLVNEYGYDNWKEFVDMQENGQCQEIAYNISNEFPSVKHVMGEIETDEPYEDEYGDEQNLKLHHWNIINDQLYDFSKNTLQGFVEFDDIYEPEIIDDSIYHTITIEASNNNLEQYLKGNNIIQIYNNKIGIRNISYPISTKFWSMLQNVKNEVLLFSKELVAEAQFDIISKIQQEFEIININNIDIIDTNSRTNQVILKTKDGVMKISKLYGGINYNGKLYYYNVSDMIIGYIGKDEEDNVYMKINDIKYLIVS